MRNTPRRLRSFAPPTRDKIFIWSAVIAGCGIMALHGRHAAITRFGTDEFTGNVLFAVFLVLTIGLYFGFQSVIESLFDRLFSVFQRKKRIAITNTPTGEEVAVELPDEPLDEIDDSTVSAGQVIQEDLYYPDDDYPEDYSGGELVEEANSDEDDRYVIINGQKVYEGPLDIDDVVFVELEHNIKEYSSLQERIELRGEYPYFEDYIGGHSVEEVTESDTLYNEWVSLQPKHIKKELELAFIVYVPIRSLTTRLAVLQRRRKRTESRRTTAISASRNGKRKRISPLTAMCIIPTNWKRLFRH